MSGSLHFKKEMFQVYLFVKIRFFNDHRLKIAIFTSKTHDYLELVRGIQLFRKKLQQKRKFYIVSSMFRGKIHWGNNLRNKIRYFKRINNSSKFRNRSIGILNLLIFGYVFLWRHPFSSCAITRTFFNDTVYFLSCCRITLKKVSLQTYT